MLTITVQYTCKYQISFASNYKFTTCGLCYNSKTGRLIKQVIKSNCIGYVIHGKFYSLTFLRTKLEKIKNEKNTILIMKTTNHETNDDFRSNMILNLFKKILLVLFFLALSVFFGIAYGQTNDKTPYIGFYGAIDLKNAITGSEPTGNKPALDYLLGVTIPINNFETGIGIERFKEIGFTKFFWANGYKIDVLKINERQLSVVPGIEGSAIWRAVPETITVNHNGHTYTANHTGRSSHLSYGVNLSIRQEITDNLAVESFSNYSFRPDIERWYSDSEKDYRYSHYLKVIYKLNL